MELLEKRSFVDVLFLLFQGELPNANQADLLERLMIAMINPGPRHPASRAAMVAGASKSDPVHLLPISLAILGGTHLGAGEIEPAMLFLNSHCEKNPEKTAPEILKQNMKPIDGDWHPVPGFGSSFGGIDNLSKNMAAHLRAQPGAGNALAWGGVFAEVLECHGLGWLPTGLAAATFCDLGFLPTAGPGLYQILCAPGILAHGLEFASKPITAVPFPNDEEYFIEED
jgi:citrate synthase